MIETLQIRDRKLYVVNEDTEYDQPIKRRLWWPAVSFNLPTDWPAVDRCELGRACGLSNGRYVAYFYAPGAYSYYRKVEISLTDGGQTKAEFIESESIPCPKTKVETRYQSGHWQKYLKTRGWVRA